MIYLPVFYTIPDNDSHIMAKSFSHHSGSGQDVIEVPETTSSTQIIEETTRSLFDLDDLGSGYENIAITESTTTEKIITTSTTKSTTSSIQETSISTTTSTVVTDEISKLDEDLQDLMIIVDDQPVTPSTWPSTRAPTSKSIKEVFNTILTLICLLSL